MRDTKLLEKFAEKASFLTTESSQKAGGFAAANIGLHPIDNIPVIVKLKVFKIDFNSLFLNLK